MLTPLGSMFTLQHWTLSPVAVLRLSLTVGLVRSVRGGQMPGLPAGQEA